MKNSIYNISESDRMFVYAWYEKTNINESKFGQRFVFAGQNPYDECLKRIRESIGVRKDLFDDGTIVLSMIWDVTDLANRNGMMDKKSKFDDFLRANIGNIKQNEVHNLNVENLVEKVNEVLRKEGQPRPELKLSTAQYDDAVILLDAIKKGKRRIIAELAARYGKTLWSSAVGVESDIPVIVVASYVLTSFTSFKNEIRKFQQFQNIEIVDSQKKSYQNEISQFVKEGKQVMVFLSLCNGSGRTERVNYLKHLDVQKIVFVDEADYGAHQKKQFDALHSMVTNDDVLILMTGTNSDRASSDWGVDFMISTTYFELLVNKKEAINFVD
jgi:hypothetical protein